MNLQFIKTKESTHTYQQRKYHTITGNPRILPHLEKAVKYTIKQRFFGLELSLWPLLAKTAYNFSLSSLSLALSLSWYHTSVLNWHQHSVGPNT